MVHDEKSEETTIRQILQAIKSIHYGYVQITIHDSRIVQIDKTEKIRLRDQNSEPKGGDTEK